MRGEEYKGRRQSDEGRTILFDVKKPKRALKPRCSCKITKRNKFKCETIKEETRKQIFEHFWKLDWGQRKIEICHLVDSKSIQQQTTPSRY